MITWFEFPSDTAIWMHYMDSNKMAGEDARRQLHKNAASNLEQILAATPHKTPTAKAGRPARTYIQQLCEDTGCCPDDLAEAMNDREKWREIVRDIRAASTT